MKILKKILFVLIGLILLFFLVGVIKPSINYGHEITVNKSSKETWAVSKDPTKFDQWLEGFKSIELISGEQDAIGSKYKVIVNPGEGQPDFEMIQTIVDMKEFERIEMSFDSDLMTFNQVVTHDEKDGKTKVKTASTVAAKGAMMRSMFAIMEMLSGSFTTQETKNIEALKKLIEENTTDYYPAPVVEEMEPLEEEMQ